MLPAFDEPDNVEEPRTFDLCVTMAAADCEPHGRTVPIVSEAPVQESWQMPT
jgi:hypothetical protein